MNKTKIEWVKNPLPPHIKVDENGRWHDPRGKFAEQPGYTWNPITGCLNGCEYCYARKLANGRLRERYLANRNFPFPLYGDELLKAYSDPFYPRFWPERVWSPRHYRKPCGIFVCDMGELFGGWVPRKWQDAVFETINKSPQHRFYLLTKQPQNLIKFSPFPGNCWVGVTATNDQTYMAGLEGLLDIRAKVRFISFEPLLEEVINNNRDHGFCNLLAYALINWVIIGSQTKPYKPPKIEWVEEIVKAADKAGVPVFLKDNLKPILPMTLAHKAHGKHGKHTSDKYTQPIRQEVPR